MNLRVVIRSPALLTIAMFLIGGKTTAQTQAAGAKKPNILFIMGDDIGWMQVGVYHRGIGLGETPNFDRLAKEGGMFTTYYAMQSCTSGRNVFLTGMYPLRTVPEATPAIRSTGCKQREREAHEGDLSLASRVCCSAQSRSLK